MTQFQLSATGFEKQNPNNFSLERATANLLTEVCMCVYSYIVRPEKAFLTQSCNNTYLRIFQRYSYITPLTSNILLSSLLRMDWIVSVWTDLTSPQWEHLKSVIKLTL